MIIGLFRALPQRVSIYSQSLTATEKRISRRIEMCGKRSPPKVKREAFKAHNKRRLRNLLNENKGFFIDCLDADVGIKEILKTIVDEAAVIAQAEATNSVVITDDNKGQQ